MSDGSKTLPRAPMISGDEMDYLRRGSKERQNRREIVAHVKRSYRRRERRLLKNIECGRD